MKKTYQLIIICFLLISSLISYAQTNPGNPSIHKDVFVSGNSKEVSNANLSVKMGFNGWNNAVSEDGTTIFANDTVYKKTDNQWTTMKPILPSKEKRQGWPTLSANGQYLSCIENEPELAIVHFFDIAKQTEQKNYVFTRAGILESMGHFTINRDCTIFAFSIYYPGKDPAGYSIYIVDRKEDGFETSKIGNVDSIVSKMLLSSSGNRLFYRATVEIDRQYETKLFMVERNGKGW